MRYDSPTVIGMAFFIVCFFAQINNVPKCCNGFIQWAGESAFAIYLINDNPMFRTYIIENKFATISNNAITLMVLLPTIAIMFSVVAILVDRVRIRLFRYCHIYAVQNRADIVWNEIVKKIYRALYSVIMNRKN